jgi:hypothetical protein
MFRHHNPLTKDSDYNYFVRCVDRFKKLLNCSDKHKLFIIFFPNMEIISDDIKKNVIEFNNKFLQYTTNYTLLVIFNLSHKEKNYSDITKYDNIDFLEIHTLSNSHGSAFYDNIDNIYMADIIQNMYNFDLE